MAFVANNSNPLPLFLSFRFLWGVTHEDRNERILPMSAGNERMLGRPRIRPELDVPPMWRERLPRQEFMTVLPVGEAGRFRDILKRAAFHPRETDGGFDVLGVYRNAGTMKPIWLTGYSTGDGQRVTGMLDFGGHRGQKHLPKLYFSLIRGTPDSIGFNFAELYETLEQQFAEADMNPKAVRLITQRWRPHLRPLAEIMNGLDREGRSVVFMGQQRHTYTLGELGIRTIPMGKVLSNGLLQYVHDMGNVIGADGSIIKVADPIYARDEQAE